MCLLTASIPIYYCYLISFFIFGCAELSLPPPFSLAAASGLSSLVARALVAAAPLAAEYGLWVRGIP